MPEFIDNFIDELDEVFESLDNLPPQIETLMAETMTLMAYDVEIFATEIAKEVATMTALGTSTEIIRQTILGDLTTGGRIFGRLRNSLKETIVHGINNAHRAGQYEQYDTTRGQFAWITVGGHKICADCADRSGIVMNFANWESAGLPGSGWSVCKGYCYCVLDPTGQIKTKLDVGPPEKIPR